MTEHRHEGGESMATYKQGVKSKARETIWQTAVNHLCNEVETARILKPDRLRLTWDRCHRIGFSYDLRLNDKYLREFEEALASHYRPKAPSELRVLFLSGEEPENDIKCLRRLGVRVENIWAVERESTAASAAFQVARAKHPTLKLFQGSIENFLDIVPAVFDIIYLDFTAPLLSGRARPFRALHRVFLRQALAPLSCLVTNYAVPDPNVNMDRVVAAYFLGQSEVESALLAPELEGPLTDGPSSYGLGFDALCCKIAINRDGAYSAFHTQYPMVFGSVFAPALRALGSDASRRLLLADESEQVENAGSRWAWLGAFFDHAQQSPLEQELFQKLPGSKASIRDSAFLFGRLTDVPMDRSRASTRFELAVHRAMSALPDQFLQLFCDPMMTNLWAEYVLFQIGSPYHANVDAHARFRYRAKKREMFVDQFVFDQCRPLYDYLGFLDLLDAGVENQSAQFVVRCCLDQLTKNTGRLVSDLFFGANLLGIGEVPSGSFAQLKPRYCLGKHGAQPA
jgi:hypothetical protein